ncbi:hypothetical protein PG994_012329 [Apiospora phragmitis]|uniref:Uncharacterized protein n=1 Tax=Apiospora phragmitis TaxID=2905665 RepID=A0ABR1TY49_9PEZI
MGDSHPETIRAYRLYATLAHEQSNKGTFSWLLDQATCPRRCKAVGDAHLFTALFEVPKHSIGRDRAHNARGFGGLENLDTLMNSGHMGIHSQIDNSPTQTYVDNIAELIKRDDKPDTRNEIFGLEYLRAFHWNNNKNHPTPLSYAMNHFVSVELPGGVGERHMASLEIAFHLIRKGADPRWVDPEVREKVLAEYQRRAAAADVPKESSKPFFRDNLSGMTAQNFCKSSGELAYTHMVPERIPMIVIYFVAHNTNVVPPGRIYFI